MRVTWIALLACLLTACSNADPGTTPISAADHKALRALSDRFVAGWLANDRRAVMGDIAPEAVFIPHDGVKPKVGYKAIDAFWFPNGKAVGKVAAFKHNISAIDGSGDRAVFYGRSDLTWQDNKQRYHWIGNFLFSARKERGRWLVTHMMSSDEPPVVTDVPIPHSTSGEQSR